MAQDWEGNGVIPRRPWPPDPWLSVSQLWGEEEDRGLGMRPEQQLQPEHKPVKASGATPFPLQLPTGPGWADGNQESWSHGGVGGLGGLWGRQDVEAAPGSQPDSCPGAPAHPSHLLRGRPSIAADTNFSAFTASQLLVLCGGFQSKLQLLAPGQADKPRGELLGHGIATLFGKPTDRKDGTLVLQGTVFPMLEFRLLILRGEGGKSRFRPDSRGDVFISSFPAAIHRWAWSGSVR